MKTGVICLAATLGVFGVVSPASATIIDVTYRGTVSAGGTDDTDFLEIGTNLNGDSYVATFVFNTAVGIDLNGPPTWQAFGGSQIWAGTTSPLISAIVTIDGAPVSINSGGAATVTGISGPNLTSKQQVLVSYTLSTPSIVYDFNSVDVIYGLSGDLPGNLNSSFTYDVEPNDGVDANFLFYEFIPNGAILEHIQGNVDLSSVTVSAGVPEPSTWAMMLLGFAGLGFAGYRRTKKSDATFAAA